MNPPYVELHAHSAFSFLDGASTPTELASAAALLGYPAMALTDHDGLWGSMEFAHACDELDMRAITGAELTVALPGISEFAHLTLLVETPVGYRNLCRLLTEAHAHTRENTPRNATQPWVSLAVVKERAEGLVCLTGCAREGVLAGRWERGERSKAPAFGLELLDAFGAECLRVELQRPYERHDRARNRWLTSLAEHLGVPCVATGNVHAHRRSRSRLQDALVAVRNGVGLEESEPLRRGNSSAALASPQGMALRFAEHPEAVAESARLADRLRFDLTPSSATATPAPMMRDADRQLAEASASAARRALRGIAPAASRPSAAREGAGADPRLRLSGFFLLHWEVLELAREVALEVRGRGSARTCCRRGGAGARASARSSAT